MEKPKCADCRFFVEQYTVNQHASKRLTTKLGRCKRYPPTVYACDEDNSTNVVYPLVDHDDWCGEFSQNGWVYKGDSPSKVLSEDDEVVWVPRQDPSASKS